MVVGSVAYAGELPGWNGWYVGVNGGGAWGRTSPTLVVGPNTQGYISLADIGPVQAAGSRSFDNSGGLAGVHVGVLHQWGPVVGGLEIGFDWMGLNNSDAVDRLFLVGCVATGGGACAYRMTESIKSNWLLTFLTRVGVDFGAWYPYVTGGLAVGNVKYTASYQDNLLSLNSSGVGSFSDTLPGYAVGGGVEWRWDSHWSLRGEYLNVGLYQVGGAFQIHSPDPTFPALLKYNVTANVRENIGRVALSYKF
jgi:outer membrane immunogenic protein